MPEQYNLTITAHIMEKKGPVVLRLTDLIAQATAKDPRLGADLDREFKVLSSRLPFGLNFDRHSTEAIEVPERPVREGDRCDLQGYVAGFLQRYLPPNKF
jgi:hypothetical protein